MGTRGLRTLTDTCSFPGWVSKEQCSVGRKGGSQEVLRELQAGGTGVQSSETNKSGDPACCPGVRVQTSKRAEGPACSGLQ